MVPAPSPPGALERGDLGMEVKPCPGSCRERDCGPRQNNNSMGHIDRGACKAAHVAIRSVKLRCSVLW